MSAQAKQLTPTEFIMQADAPWYACLPDDWDVFDEMMRAYADHIQESKWISVEDGLPEIGQKVHCVSSGEDSGEVKPAIYDGRFEILKYPFVGDRVLKGYWADIIKWRPFPEPPKTK